jgi:hypothetical protein
LAAGVSVEKPAHYSLPFSFNFSSPVAWDSEWLSVISASQKKNTQRVSRKV